jgi:hypothetical protein
MTNNIPQKNRVTSFFGLVVFIAIAILSLFVFSYILIFIAVLGLIVFIINYIKIKLFSSGNVKHPVNRSFTYTATNAKADRSPVKDDESYSGRTIDASQDESDQ